MANLIDIVKKGSTNRSVTLRVIDSAAGTPETGVTFETAGIDLWYRREGATKTAITEATQTVDGAHSDGGFVHIADGECRLDPPDAAFATGANYVDFGGTITGMIVIGGRVRLVDVDLEDAVRAGMTSLPNAVAGAENGVPILNAQGHVTVPDTQKVDLNTIKAQTVTCAAAVTVGKKVGAEYVIAVSATGVVTADIASISGDTAAADALEAMLDGTGAAMYLNRLDVVGSLAGRGVVKIENTAADSPGMTVDGLSAAMIFTGGYSGIEISGGVLGASILGTTGIYIAGWSTGITIESPSGISLIDPGTGGPGMITAAFSSALITQIQAGLSTSTELGTLQTHGDGAWATATGFAVAGNKMDIVDAPNAAAVTVIQAGLSTLDAAGVWSDTERTLSAFGFAVETDAASRTASQANLTGIATTVQLDTMLAALRGTGEQTHTDLADLISGLSLSLDMSAAVPAETTDGTVGRAFRLVLTNVDAQISSISGDGATYITVAPIQTSVIRPQLTTLGGLRRDLSMVQHTSGAFVFVITDGDGEPVSQAGESIEFVIFSEATGQVIASHTVGSGIVIAGDDNNQITVTVAEASTAASGAYKYVLRNTTRGAAHAYGAFDIITAPTAQ